MSGKLSNYGRRGNRGFTMTELVTVMSIVGILSAIGIPSFKYVTASNRMSAEVNSLLRDLQYARTEAIKQGLPVSVCPSLNASSSNPSCDTTLPSAWQIGWMVFVDATGSGSWQTGDPVLRVQTAFTSSDTFVADNNTTNVVTFNRLGYGSIGAGVSGPVTLLLHNSPPPVNSNWTRCLAITPVGMVTTQRVTSPQPTGNCS